MTIPATEVPHHILEACARAAHDVNTAYCEAIGDALSPPFDELTDAQRAGVIAGAKHALEGGSPAESHELWMRTRIAEGWTFGAVKDFAAKTSPCLVPYLELPEAQRVKDSLFQSVVRATARVMGVDC